MSAPMDAADLAQLMMEDSVLMTWPGLADLRLAGRVAMGPQGQKTWRRACELAQAAQVTGRLGVVAGAVKAQAAAAAALQSMLELVEAQAEQLQESHRREASLRADVIRLESAMYDAELELQELRGAR